MKRQSFTDLIYKRDDTINELEAGLLTLKKQAIDSFDPLDKQTAAEAKIPAVLRNFVTVPDKRSLQSPPPSTKHKRPMAKTKKGTKT